MIYGGNTLDDLNKIVKRTIRELKPQHISNRYDFIAVRGMSGVLVGSPVSIALRKRLIVVRKPGENSHGYGLVGAGHGNLELKQDERFIFLDDFISTGATKQHVINNIPRYCRHVGDYLYEPTEKEKRLQWNADVTKTEGEYLDG